MDDLQCKGINFDLDTKALQKYYPSESWRNAYSDVRSFLQRNGFEHIQGSGYHSEKPMSEFEAMKIIYEMKDKYKWLNKCVSVCTISDVPMTYDISAVFDKNAEIDLKKSDKKKGMGDWKNEIQNMRSNENNTAGKVDRKTDKER